VNNRVIKKHHFPAFVASVAFFLIAFSVTAHCETYTLETYYPSPVGAYLNMTVTSSSVLSRDGGSVGI